MGDLCPFNRVNKACLPSLLCQWRKIANRVPVGRDGRMHETCIGGLLSGCRVKRVMRCPGLYFSAGIRKEPTEKSLISRYLPFCLEHKLLAQTNNR